tara:strand:- start:1499 stop:1705 length:207 start_codon:yes stop_codon:yes gene_type:complete
MRVYEALEAYIVGPRTLERMINIFKVVLKKENKILINNNQGFREAYNEKVKQAEDIFEVELTEYYYLR